VRSLRAVAVVLILAVPTLAPAVAGSAPACATAGAAHAALVVGTGAQTLTYCVSLDGDSVSGVRLLQLAGQQFGLQYRLGFGGQAVCQLAGIGPSGGDCFASYPDFWGYWHGDGSGGWSWAGSGAASASIEQGDTEGWVWGSGDSGATHPAPDHLAYADVCDGPGPTQPPSPGGGGGPGGGGSAGGGGAGGGAGPGAEPGSAGVAGPSGDEAGTGMDAGADAGTPTGSSPSPSAHAGDREHGADRVTAGTTAPSSSATPITQLAAGVAREPSGGGPPVGALLAAVLIAGLGVAGWLRLRGRSSNPPADGGFGPPHRG
jgi:hypothetical protein